MCGIGGIVGGGPPDPAVLEGMAVAMAHRGPDGQRVWSDGHAGLAFRRLAIIDLDERSMQPMHLGPWHLAFNGEVYNYRELRGELEALGHGFGTEGDTEVLLHAWRQWGEGALERINGMFAFSLWNDERRELTVCADAFGEKPLYWAQKGERLIFASDIRAILTAAPALATADDDVLGPYLGLGLMPAVGQSFFGPIRRLPAAHLLRWRAGRVEVSRWWTPAGVEVPASFDEQATALRELLLDSIRLRLRSDVPVGTSLSGGVDSSAVVALSAQLAGEHSRHAFTARFCGFERDEWDYAREVAAAAGVVEHHAVEPDADSLLADLEALVRAQEEPFVSSSIYAQWRVNRSARDEGVKVLLDGQGADELLGGYPGLAGWATRARGPRAVAGALMRRDGAVARAVGAERLPAVARRAHRRRTASPYATGAAVAAAVAVDPPPPLGGLATRDPLHRELLRQSFHTSLPQLLRYADRDSMAHSVEVRLPFLDRRVAEYALSLPAEALHRDGVSKRVLRDAVRGIVPDRILDRRDKVGFETPQASWLGAPAWRRYVGEVLLDPGARCGQLIDRSAVEDDLRAGRWRDPAALWRALNLELWARAFLPGSAR